MEKPKISDPAENNLDLLFSEFGDMVYRLALVRTRSSTDAEDITQEVFLRCFRSAPSFLSKEHQKAWLIKVTINCSNSLLSSAFRKHTVALDALGEPSSEDELPDSTVYDAVMQLPDKMRTAVHLFYYENYSVKEIAEIMRSSESAVKTWLFRSRSILKNKLKGVIEDDFS